MTKTEIEIMRARLANEEEHLRWVIENEHQLAAGPDGKTRDKQAYLRAVEKRIALLRRRITQYTAGIMDGE